jgi:transposase, IS30 family
MALSYHQLDLDERRTIFRLLNAKVPVAAIARQLGRHRSTIHREVRRNHFHEQREYAGYFPLTAQDRARQRRQRLSKLRRHEVLRCYVIDKLERCWSPEQIAGRLRLDTANSDSVCHETIYQYIYGPEGRAGGLYRHLPKARRQRRPRYGRKPRVSFIPAARALAQRPSEAEDRRTFGHWEADLLIFRREHGKANLTTMIERQTRFTILLPNPDRQSNALVGRIGQAWQGLPKGSCRTVTFDRGTEFAAYGLLADQVGTEAYFCDPHSPWQKGAVENANGRIRRFLPGERNLAELADDDLASIVGMLNTTPRRCLGYRTPKEAFQDQLAALTQAA